MEPFTSSTTTRFFQIAGVYGSTLLVGYLGAFSQMGVPTITIASTEMMLQQYQKMGHIGVTTAPKLAVGTAGIYALLAYKAFQTKESSIARVYGAAALLTPLMIPFSIVFIQPINNQLNRLAAATKENGSKVDRAEVLSLLQKWKGSNYVRSCVVMIASGVGLYGTLVWKI